MEHLVKLAACNQQGRTDPNRDINGPCRLHPHRYFATYFSFVSLMYIIPGTDLARFIDNVMLEVSEEKSSTICSMKIECAWPPQSTQPFVFALTTNNLGGTSWLIPWISSSCQEIKESYRGAGARIQSWFTYRLWNVKLFTLMVANLILIPIYCWKFKADSRIGPWI